MYGLLNGCQANVLLYEQKNKYLTKQLGIMNNNAMNELIIKDPKILKSSAVKAVGNQAKLARLLGIGRSTVCEWKEYIPPYHAYRLLQIYPHLNDDD